MRVYFDDSVAPETFPATLDGLRKSWARFDPKATRAKLIAAGGFDPEKIVPFLAKPFDARWAYAEPHAKLWNEARAALTARIGGGQSPPAFLLARARSPRAHDGAPFAFFSGLADQHALHKDAYLAPIGPTGPVADNETPEGQSEAASLNLSTGAAGYLTAACGQPPSAAQARALWMHVLAIGYSPAYQAQNDDAVRADWPRVPLPRTYEVLLHSCSLGERLAQLLDVSPWSSAKVSLPEGLGVLSSSGGPLDPACDLAITASWGIAGRGGIAMPGSGRLRGRDWGPDEISALATTSPGILPIDVRARLGDSCFDVYMNDRAYWSCVPERVWNYTIGGFQVMKKWLSYRERPLLGRDLTVDEARYVTEMTRRIAAILLLEPALDANYEAVKTDTYDW